MDVEQSQSNGHLVDINSATGEAIRQINGIGPVLAQRIVEFRETNGPFAAVDQLTDIQGIGASLLRRISSSLTVSAGLAARSAEQPAEEPVVDDAAPTEGDMIEEPIQELEDAVPQEPTAETEEKSIEAAVEPAVDGIEAMEEEIAKIGAVETVEAIDESVAEMGEAVVDEPVAELNEPEDSPEDMANEAADELEQEVAAADAEITEMGLYTRATAEDGLSEWSPPPAVTLDDVDEQELEPDEPDWLADEEPVDEAIAEIDEPAMEVDTPHEEAYASEPVVIEEPVAAPVAAAPVASAAADPTPEPARRKEGVGFWRSLLLVLLGGLLGVLLTLAIAIIWTGTLDFASRAQVDAISRNVGTMQANQELAWQRIDDLAISNQEMAARVAELEQLRGTVTEMQGSLAEAEQELAATQASVDALGNDVDQLRTSMDEAIVELDERVGTNTEAVATLDASISALEESFSAVEERVGMFDGFFTSLRDLLIDMQGVPEPAEPAIETATE